MDTAALTNMLGLIAGVRKKVHGKNGHGKNVHGWKKRSTEITSTRKKGPLGNNVHLQGVEKRSTKVGK